MTVKFDEKLTHSLPASSSPSLITLGFPVATKQCDIIDPQILQPFLSFDIVLLQPRFHVAPGRKKGEVFWTLDNTSSEHEYTTQWP